MGLVAPGEDCSPTPMHDDATLTMLGIGRACAGWRPVARVPIAATVALSAGRLAPVSVTAIADGYEPFDETIPYARVQVGLSWR